MVITYHMTVDLAWALQRPPASLKAMLINETGQPWTGWEVRRLLKAAQAAGYVVLPVCEHHNARGFCQGHKTTVRNCVCDVCAGMIG